MSTDPCDSYLFERGVVVISIDTEQIWGYLDPLTEAQYQSQYPDAPAAHDKLLTCLRAARIGATWMVVGGMALEAIEGPRDRRLAGLPPQWATKIRAGTEISAPLWYHQSFVKRLRDARPFQEIGLHGGLTHFIWNGAGATRETVNWELNEGVRALGEVCVRPSSFSFARDREAFHELLPEQGIRTFRGRTPVLAYRLGRTLPGAMLRVFDEVRCAVPPLIWPHETLPGLWNIPSSLFLYPITPSRTRVVSLQTRVERFKRGVEAAARYHGLFHFSLHPENLAESSSGFSLFEEILEILLRARERGDVDTMTMAEVGAWMEKSRERTIQDPLLASTGIPWLVQDPLPAARFIKEDQL
jgi:hypothetical protein